MAEQQIDDLCINTIRFLSVDMVQKAKSGHPGAPLGASPMTYTLWDRFLKHNPADPVWPDRDRFILSAGHASAMLYSLLHLTGYNLSLDEIKNFRQWESKTPGHPEIGLVPGVELSTGPLGQGFANGVGMALAEKWLAAHYNKPDNNIIDHYTYALVSDGDLQEGVASEAASLAGTLRLGKLIYLYDDNDISIEGSTDITFTEDVGKRFEAYGWQVVGPVDGMNVTEVEGAIKKAQAEKEKPSIIICRTTIGYGSPNKANKASSHGEPLGEEEVVLTKENLGWPEKEPFAVPADALAHFREALDRGAKAQQAWEAKMDSYRKAYPEDAAKLEADLSGELPAGWDEGIDSLFESVDKPMATREASGKVMNLVAPRIHALLGGSADLGPSNKTVLADCGSYGMENYCGRNLHFGIREHAMGSIANGMSVHGGTIPYTATFFVFSDYMRPPIRMAALMGIRSIYVFSHDSIGVGEDGPTHQPIEQLMGLRTVPGLVTIRPADATETAEAWKIALERKNGPTALILSRQNLPVIDRKGNAPAAGVRKGAYILKDADGKPDVIIMATGSEVSVALDAGKLLAEKGVKARIVSMPSWELFNAQSEDYRNSVLPPDIRARVSVEAGTTVGWERYVGLDGTAVGIPHFGASAPANILFEKFGINAQNVADKALKLAGK